MEKPLMTRTVSLVSVFALLMACTFGFGLDLISSLLPDIKDKFQLSDGDVGLITGIGRLGFVLGAILSGIMTVFITPTRIVLLASFGCGLGLLALSFTQSSFTVASAIFFISACTALSWVPMTGVFSLFVAEKDRAKAFGAIIAGAGVGTSLVGLLFPYFVEYYSWRTALIAAAIFTGGSVLIGILASKKLTLLPQQNGRAKTEKHVQRNVKLVDHIDFRLGGILAMFYIVGCTVHPFQIFLSTYIRGELGFSATIAGNTWLTIGLVGTWAGLAMGYLGDRIGIRATMILASFLLVSSSIMLIELHDPMWFIATAFVFSLAYYSMPGLLPAYLSINYPERISVQLFSVGSTLLGLGTVTGNIVGGQLSLAYSTLSAYYWACAGASIVLAGFAFVFMVKHPQK
jgi:predicted MFS family arabinose efflux permease